MNNKDIIGFLHKYASLLEMLKVYSEVYWHFHHVYLCSWLLKT